MNTKQPTPPPVQSVSTPSSTGQGHPYYPNDTVKAAMIEAATEIVTGFWVSNAQSLVHSEESVTLKNEAVQYLTKLFKEENKEEKS